MRFDAATGPYRRTLDAPLIAGALQVTGNAAGHAPSSGLHRAYAATTPAATSLRRHGRNCARARYRNQSPHLRAVYPLIYVLEVQLDQMAVRLSGQLSSISSDERAWHVVFQMGQPVPIIRDWKQ